MDLSKLVMVEKGTEKISSYASVNTYHFFDAKGKLAMIEVVDRMNMDDGSAVIHGHKFRPDESEAFQEYFYTLSKDEKPSGMMMKW